MTIRYELENSDFLAYQLYAASVSEQHKKQRLRSRIIIPIIYMIFGGYLAYNNRDLISGIVFLIMGLLWFIGHPRYARWRYKRHFRKHIEATHKNRVNQPIEIDFNTDHIHAKDITAVSTIKGSELKALIETAQHFFIKLTSDMAFIVPKSAIDNHSLFKHKILQFGAEYVDERHWKWH